MKDSFIFVVILLRFALHADRMKSSLLLTSGFIHGSLMNCRERGARALEERLAAERLAAGKKAEESERDVNDNV